MQGLLHTFKRYRSLHTHQISRSLTGNERALLRCLVYFDIFRYPLTENELFQNAQFSGDKRDFTESLDRLNKMGLVTTREKFLMLVNAPAENVSRRIDGNA